MSGVYHMRGNQQVVMYQLRRLVLVGLDAADLPGGQKDKLRPSLGKKVLDLPAIRQVRLVGRLADKLVKPGQAQLFPQCYTDQGIAAGNIDA
jgi:hypothetical protein